MEFHWSGCGGDDGSGGGCGVKCVYANMPVCLCVLLVLCSRKISLSHFVGNLGLGVR